MWLWAWSTVPRATFKILKPTQNGHHFPNGIFKCIFLNENGWISIKFHCIMFNQQYSSIRSDISFAPVRRIYASHGLNELWLCWLRSRVDTSETINIVVIQACSWHMVSEIMQALFRAKALYLEATNHYLEATNHYLEATNHYLEATNHYLEAKNHYLEATIHYLEQF